MLAIEPVFVLAALLDCLVGTPDAAPAWSGSDEDGGGSMPLDIVTQCWLSSEAGASGRPAQAAALMPTLALVAGAHLRGARSRR